MLALSVLVYLCYLRRRHVVAIMLLLLKSISVEPTTIVVVNVCYC